MNTTITKSKSKAQAEREKVLALLDEGDAEVPANPGRGGELNGSGESFAQLFEGEKAGNAYNVGDVVTGTVVDVREDFVLVDIKYKSEGLIPIAEFRLVDGGKIEIGTEVEVYIDRVENENGMVVLSKDKADMLRAWNDISKAAANEEVIQGTIIAKVKGGLSVDIGVKAFLPGSQVDLRPVSNMDAYLGKKFDFKVIKFNKRRGNIVLSRRALLEAERDSLRTQTIDTMKEGAVITGMVKNITDYGAFIDLGGMDGLLHITDMSWKRIKHPTEVLELGQDIEVKVLKYDEAKGRVSLGLKQMKEDPWSIVPENYPKGRKLEGKVVSLTDYGAFVSLGDGVEGLIHVSEMSWTKKLKHPSQKVSVDEAVKVIVLDIDSDNRRISLGMKQFEENPWLAMESTYPPGTIIEGEVKSLTDFGAFIGIEDGVDGLVHISDFSWIKRISHASEVLEKGQKVRAVVLGVDPENERFSLGLKQLEQDPWSNIEEKYSIGSQHDVTVKKLADFGVFVELQADIEGLIHISELTTQRIDKTEDFCKVGETLKAEIMTIDKDARKIGLSAKLVKLREQKVDVEDYVKKATSTSSTSLGDVFGDAFKDSPKPTEGSGEN